MKYILILLFLFSSCSLTEIDHSFLEYAEGTYTPLESSFEPQTDFEISKYGNFQLQNNSYKFLIALSTNTAYYKIDDVVYAGILLEKDGTLKQLLSLTSDTNGIPPFTDHNKLVTIAKKTTNSTKLK